MRTSDDERSIPLERLEMALREAARCVVLYGAEYAFIFRRLEHAVAEARRDNPVARARQLLEMSDP